METLLQESQTDPDSLKLQLEESLKKNARLLKEIERLQSELAKAKEEAATDHLTGLPNRRVGEIALNSEIGKTQRGEQGLAVIIFDLDYFKQINDTYGHLQGDNILKSFAAVLQAGIRQGDLAARYGGEEFLVILPLGRDANPESITTILERLQTNSHQINRSPQDNEKEPLSFSAGCAFIIPGTTRDRDQILAIADEALYQAKNNGRGRSLMTIVDDHQQTSFHAL